MDVVQKHIYDKGYTFPVFRADSIFEYTEEVLDIHGVPQILVLNSDSRIVYTIHLHTDIFIKVDNVYKIIDCFVII